MSAELARQRYLRRHIEANLPPCPEQGARWRNVLVIPAYRESDAVLRQLSGLSFGADGTLVIVVLNRPDSDPDVNANDTLRAAIDRLGAGEHGLRILRTHTDLYLHDSERLTGPIPAARGVGLARKIGCDIALKWMCAGAISGRWICSTDADARLPPDYFARLDALPPGAVAASFPFRHVPGADASCNSATALYELRLHHYVLGLEYAHSPYACHTLGSCMAVTADGYAQVRGIPRRAGAEDFYLLNKLAKIAPVNRLTGNCLQLESRTSNRVPFGTGPAVAKIAAAHNPLELPLYEQAACFEALRVFLLAVPGLWQAAALPALPDLLTAAGLDPPLARASGTTLTGMGLAGALEHCQRQAKTPAQFMRQFHQWFDALRTLKLIHGIRDRGWPEQSFTELAATPPVFWPAERSGDPDDLRTAIARAWGWRQQRERNHARQADSR